MTHEYFIVANSFAAPFFSDDSTAFVSADTPQGALVLFAANYSHPAGLYAALCYESTDAYHKHAEPLAKWLSNHERAKQRAVEGRGAYSYLGKSPGCFEIDGEEVKVENPKQGSVSS